MAKQKLDFWKPFQGKGAAAIFDFNQDKGAFWLVMMPEEGDRKFNSQASIRAKLGRADIGEFLAVLHGRIEGAGAKDKDKGTFKGLYHKSGQGDDNTIIGFSPYVDKDGNNRGYTLSLSTVRSGTKNRYQVGITHGEAELMRMFFLSNLPRMFEEDGPPGQENPDNQGNA